MEKVFVIEQKTQKHEALLAAFNKMNKEWFAVSHVVISVDHEYKLMFSLSLVWRKQIYKQRRDKDSTTG